VPDNTLANLRIDAAGSSGSVPLAAASTSINTLQQNSTTAATIDTSAGSLRVGSAGGILISPTGQSLTIGTAADAGSLTAGGSAANVAGDLVLGNFSSTNALTVNSTIIDNGSGVVTLTKTGGGNAVLNGTNTYTGTTFVSAGTLTLGANNAVGNGDLTIKGGTLAMGSFNDTVGAVTLLAGSLTGTGTLTSTSGFTFDNVAAATASPVLAGSVGFTKRNLGNLTVSGANTYTGATTITEGRLIAGVASVAGVSGAFGVDSTVSISAAPSAVLDLAGFNSQIGSLGGGGAVGGGVVLGAGTLTTGGTNASTAYAGVISGTGAIVKNGTGTWTVSGASSYSGLTTVNAGVLKLGGAGNGTNSPLGTAALGTVIAATGAALDLNGLFFTTAEPLTLNGSGVSGGGALTNSNAGPATFGGLVTLGSDSSIVADSGAVIVSNAGTISGSGFGLTLGGNAPSNQVSSLASIIGTGAGPVTKTGTGTWLLSGANTFTGQLTIENGTFTGTLEYTSSANATSSKVFQMASGGAGRLQIDGAATTLTLSSALDGAGDFIKSGAGTLSLTSAANSLSGRTTVSAGTLSLSNNTTSNPLTDGLYNLSTYIDVQHGATLNTTGLLNNGLTLAGPLASVFGGSGQTIGGNGTIVGGLTIAQDTTLSPGASPGILSQVGNQTWATGGNYNWQVYDAAGAAGTGFDQMSINGTLTIQSGFNVNLWSLAGIGPDVNGDAINFNPAQSASWVIATASGGLVNASNLASAAINVSATNGTNGFTNNLYGNLFSLAQGGQNGGPGTLNDVVLTYTSMIIPEPSTFALAAAGIAALAVWSRRRRTTRWHAASPTQAV
jgi:autotransporter-associated beta strand protein